MSLPALAGGFVVGVLLSPFILAIGDVYFRWVGEKALPWVTWFFTWRLWHRERRAKRRV